MDTRSPDGSVRTALVAAGGLTAALLAAAARGGNAVVASRGDAGRRTRLDLRRAPPVGRATAVHAARRLNRAAGTIAGSVLFDSAVEHYRGQFHNKAMYTPLVTASLSVLVSAHGHRDETHGSHLARDAAYAATALVGLIGTGFHAYNVGKKPGGFRIENLFYQAPLGAPAALTLSGLLGFLSERVRDNVPGTPPRILGLSAGRTVGVVTGAGIVGTVAEAALLHFRGAFHNPVMLLPVTMPPVAASLIAAASLSEAGVRKPATRWWLRATAILGIMGSVFHAIGVGRSMGGWRNWRQNLLDGPPIPAPPAFTGLAMAGLAALGLLEDHPDD